jgi:preprotein translocase subunit SecG
MTTIVLVLQFVLAIILTIAVLLQKSSSIGLGAYSGSNESLFGAKGPAGFLAKFTFVVGFLFILNTLALGYFYNQAKKASLAEQIKVQKPIKKYPTIPSVPTTTNKTDEAPKAPTTK